MIQSPRTPLKQTTPTTPPMQWNRWFARMRWSCRRGMLEVDLILQNYLLFLSERFDKGELNSDDFVCWDTLQDEFQSLTTQSDQTLYRWLLGIEQPKKEEANPLLKRLKRYSRLHSQ